MFDMDIVTWPNRVSNGFLRMHLCNLSKIISFVSWGFYFGSGIISTLLLTILTN
jgi:hypothetical protein